MRSFPSLVLLLLALGSLGAQEPKPATPPADKAAPAPKPKAPAKPKAKDPKADHAELRPEVAAGSKARAKALKAQKQKAHAPTGPAVDINHATKEELKQLPGITDAYADKIIANRPFKTRTHLVTKDVLPYGLYQTLKPRLAAK